MYDVTIDERIEHISRLAAAENTELGDALGSMCHAINSLRGIGEDHAMQLVLLAAEQVASTYCEWLRFNGEDHDFEYLPLETFKHFTGGAVHEYYDPKMKFKKDQDED